MKRKNFEYMEHTSEMKFKVKSSSLKSVFENVTLAFSDFISRGQKVRKVKSRKVKIEAENNEALLYEFLDELIYLLDAKGFVVASARLKVTEGKLEGVLYGDSAKKYNGLDHAKAPTYSEMHVKKKKLSNSWEAQFVLDV